MVTELFIIRMGHFIQAIFKKEIQTELEFTYTLMAQFIKEDLRILIIMVMGY